MKKIVGSFVAITMFYAFVHTLSFTPLFGIRINATQSLPYKLFLSKPISKLKKGQYVLFTHSHTSVPLVKQVLGTYGDVVSVHEGHICINGIKLGRILEHSKSGRSFTPIAEAQVKEGYVFVYAPHEESFDSRYEEFGLVKEEQIQETLWPIF